MIRDIKLSDLQDIETMHKGQFPLPKKTLVSKVVEYNGELIGAGFLKLTTEAILVINSSSCRLTRARAIKELLAEMIKALDEKGIDDSHVFLVDDEEKTSRFLSLFGFIPATGKPMYLPPKG